MPQLEAYIYAPAAVFLFGLGWFIQQWQARARSGRERQTRELEEREAHDKAIRLVQDARLEAKEEFFTARQRFEKETEQIRSENRRRVENLDVREGNLDKKVAFIDQKEERLDRQDEDMRSKLAEISVSEDKIAGMLTEQRQVLEEVAGMSAENARRQLMEEMVSDARLAAAKSIQQIREETERTAKREAMKIISLAVQRYASEHVAESTVSVVDLPSVDMKGRIIGREGRNIRAFEQATGVDVIIDDTPGAVLVSGFDPVRREVARQSLAILVGDGRIHPARIEEIVEKTAREMDARIREIGEQTCLELGLQNVASDLYPYIGRLNYRTSYGQNLLKHSLEVAAVAAVVASELGLDPRLARRCGFLHDIGKAASHEVEGPHALIGARMCRKFGEDEAVINAVEGHHQDVEPTTPYTFITAAADAISASRPGARRESLETYVQRLENLEQIAEAFDGVEKSYAIQAGREIRVLVDHGRVSDAEAAVLAEEVSRRIEGELEYPGQIKVMVIRETRATAYAR
ncbi:ribonuclease Y [bacterium]|nr:MAG: ribonuclease Y [bacterium]